MARLVLFVLALCSVNLVEALFEYVPFECYAFTSGCKDVYYGDSRNWEASKAYLAWMYESYAFDFVPKGQGEIVYSVKRPTESFNYTVLNRFNLSDPVNTAQDIGVLQNVIPDEYMNDLATDPRDDSLYSCGMIFSSRYLGYVWSVDVVTAARRVEKDFGPDHVFISCAIDSGGTMFLLDIYDNAMYTSSVGVWNLVRLATYSVDYGFAQSMSTNYRDDVLVAAFDAVARSGTLSILDKATGDLTPFWGQAATIEICALACPNHNLTFTTSTTTTSTVAACPTPAAPPSFPIALDLRDVLPDAPTPCAAWNQIFFCFTADVSGTHTFDTCSGSGDTVIGVYRDGCATCPPLGVPHDCSDDACGLMSSVSIHLVAGEKVTIEAGTYGQIFSFSGNLSLAVIPDTSPPSTSTSASISIAISTSEKPTTSAIVLTSVRSSPPPPPPPPHPRPTEYKDTSDGGSMTWIVVLSVVGGILGCALVVGSAAVFVLKKGRGDRAHLPYQASPYPLETFPTPEPSAAASPFAPPSPTPPAYGSHVGLPIPHNHYVPAPASAIDVGPGPGPGARRSVSALDAEHDDSTLPAIPIAGRPDNSVIQYSEILIGAEVGRGAFGVVYSGRWRGAQVAIKNLISGVSAKDMDDFTTEAATMVALRPHVNVVQLLGICLEPLAIVTEFMEEGSLHSFLMDKEKTPEIEIDKVKKAARGIAAGMLHLHSEDIVHRDLAARNVLIGSGFAVKITDFGLSRAYKQDASSNVTTSDTGPLKWMPPEAIRHRQYSKASDVWAFGVTIYELVDRIEPYGDMDAVQVALAVTTESLRLQPPERCPKILASMIADCQRTEAEDRPDMQQIGEALETEDAGEWAR
jgi:hypothetical protein